MQGILLSIYICQFSIVSNILIATVLCKVTYLQYYGTVSMNSHWYVRWL